MYSVLGFPVWCRGPDQSLVLVVVGQRDHAQGLS